MNISNVKFDGADAVELKTTEFKMVIVTQYGPRIAFFGKPDDNLLLWEPGKHTRGDWDLRGGHRVWVTRPGADECEDTYSTDNERCDVQTFDNGVCVLGAENPSNKTRRGLRVDVIDESRVLVDAFLSNTGDMLYSGGVWALTCTVPSPGTQYGVPIGDGSSWDSFNMIFFREWGGHGQGGFNDPQIEVLDDIVRLTPKGVENKRALLAHKGIIGMSDPKRGITFAKQVDYDCAGSYPLNTNIAFYVGPDNFMVEMETMGPEQTLKPGVTVHHVEKWALKDTAVDLSDAKALTQMFEA